MENKKKTIMLVFGPTMSGKSTFINELTKLYPNIFFNNPKFTTREQRTNNDDSVLVRRQINSEHISDYLSILNEKVKYIYCGNIYAINRENFDLTSKIPVIPIGIPNGNEDTNEYFKSIYISMTGNSDYLEPLDSLDDIVKALSVDYDVKKVCIMPNLENIDNKTKNLERYDKRKNLLNIEYPYYMSLAEKGFFDIVIKNNFDDSFVESITKEFCSWKIENQNKIAKQFIIQKNGDSYFVTDFLKNSQNFDNFYDALNYVFDTSSVDKNLIEELGKHIVGSDKRLKIKVLDNQIENISLMTQMYSNFPDPDNYDGYKKLPIGWKNNAVTKFENNSETISQLLKKANEFYEAKTF